MKSPDEIRRSLRRQWLNGETRQARLLDTFEWPLRLPIGKPKPMRMQNDLAAVRAHLESWRKINVGDVEWRDLRYQSLSEPVSLPVNWYLHSAREWVEAMRDPDIQREYGLLDAVLQNTDPLFHAVICRQRQMVLSRGIDELIQACRVADGLTAGTARGRPLRAISVAGSDSKFFERNRSLLIRLLQQRFGEEALECGLEAFLDAEDESEHWLLVAPLAPGLLPFEQLRLRTSELRRTALPGSGLIVVENERCLHQLPSLPGTIAILGAGLNLGWMDASWLAEKSLAYWGDLDTWGLSMLARARRLQPGLTALLMDRPIFESHAPDHAVVERVKADAEPPDGLTPAEQALYRHLQGLEKGRLEQEFLPVERVGQAFLAWLD